MVAVSALGTVASSGRPVLAEDAKLPSSRNGSGSGRAGALTIGTSPLSVAPRLHPFASRNCLFTQFSSRPSRRKRAAVRAANARLSRMLSGV